MWIHLFTFSFREPTKMSSPLLSLDGATIGYDDKVIAEKIRLQITLALEWAYSE